MRSLTRQAATIAFSAAAIGYGVLGLGLVGCRAEPKAKTGLPVANSRTRIESKGPRTEDIGWLTVRLENPPPDSLMAVKPEDLPAHLKSLYRLRPDRRFLYAAAELQRLSTGGPRRGTLGIRFEGNRWRLSLDGSPFGELPELASFADARTLLVGWARAQPAFHGPAAADPLDTAGRAALDNGLPADLFPALARLDVAWKTSTGDPALVGASLRGLLWLALQTRDELELGDPILGKALAVFALAEAREPGHFARQECLLADLLGYEDHARLVGRDLRADDPVRLFADWDLAALKALAHRPQPEPRTEYLYLLRLAQNRPKEDAWFEEFERSSWGVQLDGPSLRLVLTLDPFGLRDGGAALMERQVLEALSLDSSSAHAPAPTGKHRTWRQKAAARLEALQEEGQKPPEGRLSELEGAVNNEGSRLDGALLDRQVVRSYYLANFYSSVYAAARYFFDRFGSTEAAESLGQSLANPPAGTAAELKDWILHRVQLRRSADGNRVVAADLSRLRHIGTDPLSRISYSVAISITSDVDWAHRAFVSGFFDRLDSRPSDLHSAFRTASELLHDPAIMEQCMRLAVQREPRELDRDLPWALRFLGDRAALEDLTKDKTRPMTIRSKAVELLAELEKTEPLVLVERFRELIRQDASESEPLWAAIGILEKEAQNESALQLIDQWLRAHTDRDLQRAGISSQKSRFLRKQGKFQEAWLVAKAAAETGKEECLREATLALIDLGRLDQALDMAKSAREAYDNDDDTALMARVLWMQGKDEESARLLTPPAKPMGTSAWSGSLPAAFLEAFKKAEDARAEVAFVKLIVPGVPTLNLIWFVERLTAEGRAALAVRLCGRLRGRTPAAFVTVTAYHAMRKSQGAEAARNWLHSNATPAELDVFPKQALQDGDYELLWDIPDHPDPTKNEILYMIRAASLLHRDRASEERRARLLTFFRARPRKDFVVYGLFFLGEVDRATLFAQIKDVSYICSIGWILGLTSAHEGRYEEANAWLQICMEAGANIPPRYFATNILSRWTKEGRTLEEIARKEIY